MNDGIKSAPQGRMPDQEVADHGLERFGVWRPVLLVDHGHNNARVSDLGRVAGVASHDAKDTSVDRASVVERVHNIRRRSRRSAAYRQDQHYVIFLEVARD